MRAVPQTPPPAVRVLVPGGLWEHPARGEPVRLRELELRPVGAQDELLLLDSAGLTPPCRRATALLGRCLSGGEELARRLSVGDREALLLHLRRLTLGEVVEGVLRCSSPSCGRPMDLRLRVDDLLVAAYPDARPSYRLDLVHAGARYEIDFRVPVSDDLEHGAALARTDPEAAGAEILRRCVLRADRDGASLRTDALPAQVRAALIEAIGERDTQAEIELELTCPECGASLQAILDAAAVLLGELDQRAARLLHEVHALALRYGWSEAEILAMAPRRRAAYLELADRATA